jgi:RNA polymerase subunit RPABC4/transcription elongation factor Spt4
MKYCTNCGNLLGENDQTICPACKTVVKHTGETPGQAIIREQQQSPFVFLSVGYKDNFWVRNLRIWGYLLFIGTLISGAVVGYGASEWMRGGEKALTFIIIFVLFAIGGFLLVAAMMLFVEMASDIGKIRHMLENRKN